MELTNFRDCWDVVRVSFAMRIPTRCSFGRLQVRQLAASVQGAALADVPGTIADLVRRLETLAAGQPPSLSREQLLASLRPETHPATVLTASAATGSLSASLTSPGGKGASNSLKCMFAKFFDKYHEDLDKQGHKPTGKDTTIPARYAGLGRQFQNTNVHVMDPFVLAFVECECMHALFTSW